MLTAQAIIKKLGLKPLTIEGGYYRETYRSPESIGSNALPQRYGRRKCFGTAIYYLLTPDTFSTIHKVSSDETFHFYLGDPVTMLQLYPKGKGKICTLGQDILHGQLVQVTVSRQVWQGCMLKTGGSFALLGTTVAPGFDFSDYREGMRDELVKKYPGYRKMIVQLTRQ